MIELQKMAVEEFESIMEKSLLKFISDLEVYQEEFEEKLSTSPKKFAEKQWSQMLPDGINTENNYFWIIKKFDSVEPIGHLWLLKQPKKKKNTFIADIFLKKEYRNAGYGTSVLKFVEKIAKMDHLSKAIELHVFKHNPRAVKFYERIGFENIEEDFTGYRMIKKI
ncbi:hypothetical protein ES705_13619 [subsurface metagenome]|jgi:ribosomal protein S18 acetylase RimI-like enzyme